MPPRMPLNKLPTTVSDAVAINMALTEIPGGQGTTTKMGGVPLLWRPARKNRVAWINAADDFPLDSAKDIQARED